jgi:hypothetical protein
MPRATVASCRFDRSVAAAWRTQRAAPASECRHQGVVWKLRGGGQDRWKERAHLEQTPARPHPPRPEGDVGSDSFHAHTQRHLARTYVDLTRSLAHGLADTVADSERQEPHLASSKPFFSLAPAGAR